MDDFRLASVHPSYTGTHVQCCRQANAILGRHEPTPLTPCSAPPLPPSEELQPPPDSSATIHATGNCSDFQLSPLRPGEPHLPYRLDLWPTSSRLVSETAGLSFWASTCGLDRAAAQSDVFFINLTTLARAVSSVIPPSWTHHRAAFDLSPRITLPLPHMSHRRPWHPHLTQERRLNLGLVHSCRTLGLPSTNDSIYRFS